MNKLARKHADELRQMWQSRALRASHGKLRKVLITALTKEYPEAIVTLAKVTWPGFVDFDLPLFLSYAHVGPDGCILCDVMDKDKRRRKVRVYDSENHFIYETRKLADSLKLPDAERIEMFAVLQKWIASDRRYGIHGEKLAS